MLFNSYTFVLFFAAVLAVYNLPLPWRWKKAHLLVSSYVFYAAWNAPFVALLWISTLVDWYVAKGIQHSTRTGVRRGLLILSLVTNLGLLGFFKYSGFLLDNFVTVLATLGIHYEPARMSIVLPVGISFYTFQTLSYTIDVYRRKTRPWPSMLDYALYVTFFPQLVAGPIVRAVDFLPQCPEPPRVTGRQLGWGLTLLLVGLFQKVFVADGLLAPVVEQVFDAERSPGLASAWVGTLAFAGQIFCDFAGYSTCAIGAALCLGFALPDNFRHPYAAVGFSDFWQRWHISLSSWLRDYLYIPLGGNRRGSTRTYGNLLTTMLLGGLWHGAAWTFVAWGALHGGYLVGERWLRWLCGRWRIWAHPAARLLLAGVTFFLVCVAWIFFRADSFTLAWATALALFGHVAPEHGYINQRDLILVAIVVGSMMLVHWLMRDTNLERVAERMPWPVRSAVMALMLVAIITSPGDDRAFIYFQF